MAISNLKEEEKGIIDTADVLVKIYKKIASAPAVKRYANICVYTAKATGDLDGVLVTESDKSTHDAKIDDADEINFIGSIKVRNTATLTQKEVDAMAAYGETLLVTSSKSDEIKTNSAGLDFKNMIVWLTETATTTTLDAQAKLPNSGVFIDIEKKGKALFAISRLLKNPDTLQFSTQIKSESFQGITDIAVAKTLDEAGFSYFFMSSDLCWPRGFWVGGHQARAIYADRSVIYDVKNTVSNMVQLGTDFTDENVSLLEARILQSLKSNPFVTTIQGIHIPKQKPSNKVTGILSGIQVKYETAKEIRTVFIELSEAQ